MHSTLAIPPLTNTNVIFHLCHKQYAFGSTLFYLTIVDICIYTLETGAYLTLHVNCAHTAHSFHALLQLIHLRRITSTLTLYATAAIYYRGIYNRVSKTLAISSPTCCVDAVPSRSPVLTPASKICLTAFSTICASASRLKEYLSIIATERTVATGLTIPFPAISGAEPEHLVVAIS